MGERVRDVVLARAPSGRHAPALDVLVIGAGDAARGLLDVLTDPALQRRIRVSLTSRSDLCASRLAAAFGVAAAPWAARDRSFTGADVVVFAVQTNTPLVDGVLAQEPTAERGTPARWLDFGVPSNVDTRELPSTVEWVGI